MINRCMHYEIYVRLVGNEKGTTRWSIGSNAIIWGYGKMSAYYVAKMSYP